MVKVRTITFLAVAAIAVPASIGLVVFFVSQRPRTLVVPDKYGTIQSAIDKARSQDTVFIKAGTYDEHVCLKKGIRLIGEGIEKLTVRGPADNQVILAENCSESLISDLTVEHSSEPNHGARPWYGKRKTGNNTERLAASK